MWILRACSGGLVSGLAGGTKINLFTEIEDVDGIDFAVVVYRYKHNADTEHYLRKSPQNEHGSDVLRENDNQNHLYQKTGKPIMMHDVEIVE